MKRNIKINREYQICSRCIMDTSDSKITFNNKGECDHCQNFDYSIFPNWHTGEQGFSELMKNAEKIRKDGEGRDFDCIVGLSGGLDSSYTAYIAKEVISYGINYSLSCCTYKKNT